MRRSLLHLCCLTTLTTLPLEAQDNPIQAQITEAVGEQAANALLTTHGAINQLAAGWADGTFPAERALELAVSYRESAELCVTLVQDKSAAVEAAATQLVKQAAALEAWIRTGEDAMGEIHQKLKAETDRLLSGAPPAPGQPGAPADATGTITLEITRSVGPLDTPGQTGTMTVRRTAPDQPLEVSWQYEDGSSDRGFGIPFPNSEMMAVSFGEGARTLSIYRRDGANVAGRWATLAPDAKINEMALTRGEDNATYHIEGGGTFQILSAEGQVAQVSWTFPSGDVPGTAVADGDFLAVVSAPVDSSAGVGLYRLSPDAKTASGTWTVGTSGGVGTEELAVTSMTGSFLTSDAASIEHELREFAAAFQKDLGAAADLRPSPEQIAAIAATPEGAEQLSAYVETVYAQLTPGQPAADPDQTEIIFGGPALEDLPGGYSQNIAHFRPGIQFYRFKFVKPGETLGMSYDGLCRLEDGWVFIPKAWRAFSR